jgi:hypothetical protein
MVLILIISTILNLNETIIRKHKKSIFTSILAKTTRALFKKNEYIKDLSIPVIFDAYNHQMGHINKADQLLVYNPGLRSIRRESWQTMEH